MKEQHTITKPNLLKISIYMQFSLVSIIPNYQVLRWSDLHHLSLPVTYLIACNFAASKLQPALPRVI